MQFKYLDIISENEKDFQGFFISPRFLSNKEDDFPSHKTWEEFKIYYRQDCNYLFLDNKGLTLSGDNISFGRTPKISLKYSVYEIGNIIIQHKKLITIKPKEEEKKAIKAILDAIKPRDDQQVYIGQLFFDSSGQFGLSNEIVAIYIQHDRAIVCYNCRIHITEIAEGLNYKKIFKSLEPLVFSKKNYKAIVEPCLANGKKIEFARVNEEIKSYKKDTESTRKQLEKLSPKYKIAIKGIKKFKEIEATLPPEVVGMLDAGKANYEDEIEVVKDYAGRCRAYGKKLAEAEDKKKEYKDFAKRIGDDFKQVDNLIKKGVIESITYKQGEGLTWIYAPMSYKSPSIGEVFLGRVEVTLNEKPTDAVFDFDMISYPLNVRNAVGTWHFKGHSAPSGGRGLYCMGQFEQVFYALIATGRISELIIVVKDYIKSANEDSKFHRPEWSYMDITKPRVEDDSFTVWKQNHKALKTVGVTMTEEEESDEEVIF